MFYVKYLLLILFNTYCYCKNSSLEPKVGIVGGHKISIQDAPYMVSLRLNGTYHWCGGSIIHPQFVLTAAHCIVPKYKVLVGTANEDKDGTLYDVEKITSHKKYSERTAEFDASILKLSNSIQFNNKISMVSLADRQMKNKPGTLLNVTGWGSIYENGPISKDLLQVSVKLVSQISCKRSYFTALRAITNNMICAGDPGKDACQGDSGGPLTYQGVQIGISSFGAGCGKKGMPGVYTKVAAIYDWIMQIIVNYD